MIMIDNYDDEMDDGWYDDEMYSGWYDGWYHE